jgi:hypothetical protein
MFRSSVIVLVALAHGAAAFCPVSQITGIESCTQLNAENSRRNALGQMGIALGGLFVGGFAAPEESSAGLANPALQTFKGGKKTKGAFIPGKYQNRFGCQSVVVQCTFPSRLLDTNGVLPFSCHPLGKGLREKEEFNNLIAGLQNPALQTFKGGKRTKGAFIPGKLQKDGYPPQFFTAAFCRV